MQSNTKIELLVLWKKLTLRRLKKPISTIKKLISKHGTLFLSIGKIGQEIGEEMR